MNDANRAKRMQISHDALRVAVQPPLNELLSKIIVNM